MSHQMLFDPASHCYSVGGRVVPSVTQILSDLGLRQPLPANAPAVEYAGQRGVAVHAACELLEAGQLDESSIDPAITGYVDAFRLYRQQMASTIIATERQLYSGRWGFAGTLDRVEIIDEQAAVVDIKTAATVDLPATALQTAAYRLAWNEAKPDQPAHGIYCLHLRADGSYRLIELESKHPTAERTFLAAVCIWHWQKRNGFHKPEEK